MLLVYNIALVMLLVNFGNPACNRVLIDDKEYNVDTTP